MSAEPTTDAELIFKLTRLAECLKAHHDEPRTGDEARLIEARLIEAILIEKLTKLAEHIKTKHEEIQALKASLPANIAAEIEEHTQELAKKLAARA